MKFDAVIFDLDGTLTDTLEDLRDSVNFALRKLGLPERTLEEIRCFVGNGVRKLIFRSLPDNTLPEVEEECLKVFRAHYLGNSLNKTKPYPGIIDALNKIKAANIPIAVVTNKTQDAASEIVKFFFGEYFDVVIGQIDGMAKKPEPDGVWLALDKLGVGRERAVYIGDSEVDCLTAKNAGVPIIGAAWGFRGRKLLEEMHADMIADNAGEMLKFIL